MKTSRTLLVLGLCVGLAMSPSVGVAQDANPAQADAPGRELPPLVEPASTDDCLELLTAVVEFALDADMLDDQVDKAEEQLEEMETACHDRRFGDAVTAAKAVAQLIAANK